MSEREALFAGVCADPWADLPRLVFADWLEDHGDHRQAAFIRWAVEAARQSGCGRRPDSLPRTGKGRSPVPVHSGLPDLPGVKFFHKSHDRGFVAGVMVTTAADLSTHADAIRSAVPLTDVKLVGRSKARAADMEVFAQNPVLAQVRKLDFEKVPAGDAVVTALAGSPHLHGLRRLALQDTRLTEAGVRVLVAAPWFATLQQLLIGNNPALGPSAHALLVEVGRRSDLTFCDVVFPDLTGTDGADEVGQFLRANHDRIAADGRLLRSPWPPDMLLAYRLCWWQC